MREVLNAGPVKCNVIKNEAKAAGISWRTVERAKTHLKIKAYKSGAEWYWPSINSVSSPSHPDVGGLGGLPSAPTELGNTARPSSPPNKKDGTLEQVNLDSWVEIGTEETACLGIRTTHALIFNK